MGNIQSMKFYIKFSIIIFLCTSEIIYSQSRKELIEQNTELKRLYNQLLLEKQALAKKATKLDKDVKEKQVEVEKSQDQIEVSQEIIKEKTDEIITKNASISTLAEAKKISDLVAKQNKLELENRKSGQKIMGLGMSLIAIVALLLFYLYISRKKANETLELEKQKSDKLLLNILPEEIAEELKNTNKVQARSYRLTSVLFADIKGFTQISANMSPSLIIEELDYIFGAFDNIIQKHNIEKIKIIGDCYMCVGGIPQANDSNPLDIVKAAIEMQNFMHQMRLDRQTTQQQIYDIRIGINTGNVVAGVIGNKKFAYDVWGDVVNIAARLEKTCEPQKINISSSTYHFIKEHFHCEYRGKIDVKGKDGLDMYYVLNPLEEAFLSKENQPMAS